MAQQPSNDFLPLAVANRWTYNYFATDWDVLEDITWTDSGSSVYTVVSKLSAQDSSIWTFKEVRSLLHHERHNWMPVSDTTYSLVDSSLFSLVEYLSGNHRILTNVSGWNSPFYLNAHLTDSADFLRYYSSQSADTFSICHAEYFQNHVVNALTVTYQRGVGLSKVSYRAPGNIGDAPSTNHTLARAVLTSVDNSTLDHSPFSFALEQNYPNPFNPATTIRFGVHANVRVNIKVYDTLGRLVITLLDENVRVGNHALVWRPINQPSGMYLCVARTNGYSKCIKLAFVK